MAVTTEEARRKKVAMEGAVLTAIKDFEEDTEMEVVELRLQVSHRMGDRTRVVGVLADVALP